ncbi:PKD domain-containing protein [Portibacter marinus]|uniref:PKD domain-containing protein n=1 Tax=Portibacter marinus TaxID=2898660 RepID=UPI001F45E9CB|nr:PKD domain-containing protein [Portibacter marinus]
MRSILSLVTFTLFMLFFSSPLHSRHIIGGDVTYRCMGIDTVNGIAIGTYRIEFTMYRDCGPTGGAGFDNAAPIAIYRQTGSGGFSHIATEDVPVSGIRVLELEESPCQEIPAGICVQEGHYIRDIRLPVSDRSYYINYQRCCRNVTITNIVAPEDTGASFGIEITAAAQQVCNSSPRFNEFPPILICSDQPLFANQSATDRDGDVLVYKFCSPKQGGGPFGSMENPGNAAGCDGITPSPENCPPPLDDVVFRLPQYSFNNPVAADPALTINADNGVITGTPNLIGQFVVGVCIEEYRNGVLLSKVSRDFQFNVTECQNFVSAGVRHDAQIGPNEYEVISCGDFTIDFVNESQDPAFIDGYLWNFNINGNVVTSREKDIEVTFPGLGNYDGFMVVNPDEPDDACRDTAYFEVKLFPDIEADYNLSYDTCIAGPVNFTDLSTSGAGNITNWEWDFDDGDTSFIKNPAHTYREPGEKDVKLTVTDINACKDTITKSFEYLPAPPVIIIEPSTFFGCAPANIFFNNLSTPIDSTYDIFWDFGNGITSTEISPFQTFTEVGTYDVSVEIISPIGCEISRSFNNLIEIDLKPEAEFDYDPKDPTSLNPTINFEDMSTNAVRWQWQFGDQGASFERNPSFTFRDTGIHEIQLVAFHPSGCPDTSIQIIDVLPFVSYFMPNAFTPNADGNNDLFLGKGIITGMTDFNMKIFNRWGEQVFETDDPLEGWNGRKNNTGGQSQAGVYVYQLSYRDSRGMLVEDKGFATLIR